MASMALLLARNISSCTMKQIRLLTARNFQEASTTFKISTSQMSTLTKVSEENGIRRIVMANPKKRNALSLEMLQQLHKDLHHNMNNTSLRCVILAGEGPAFSAGHDLSELTTSTGIEHHKLVFSSCSDVMMSIRKLPVPVIAQVNGIAAAAGCQLAASCDIVIASEKSQFSTPGANVGLFCSTPGVALSRAVPSKVSAYMLLSALPISASDALQCGLVSKVVPEDKLEEETMKIATAITSKSRPVIELGKRFYYNQLEMDVCAAYTEGEKVMINNIRFEDAQTGMKAFLEKKKPIWAHTDRKAH